MILSFDNVQILAGQSKFDEQHIDAFSDELVDCVAGLSRFLIAARPSPEIIAFAYWCRKSQLVALKQLYPNLSNMSAKVFHITPANVDTVYMYSFVLSFLVGNFNIVRLSERRGVLSDEFVQLMAEFMTQDPIGLLKKRNCFISYPAEAYEHTKAFSVWSDTRVIWGGSETISQVKAIYPVANDVCFPDRFSVALLHLETYEQAKSAAELFCADYFPFSQQACSSPKAVFWQNTHAELIDTFWQSVQAKSSSFIPFESSQKINRFINFQAILMAEPNFECVDMEINPVLIRVTLKELKNLDFLKFHSGNGLVFESHIKEEESLPYHPNLQTIGYYGCDSKTLEQQHALRITPLGSALTFNHVWDGVDLIKALSLRVL